MARVLGWLFQVLILTIGIYLFLRFVRTTRGSLLIRGLLLALVVGVLGIWGLSEVLELEELAHVIKGLTGFVAVIFVILFQPELRRGISQLGESQLLGQLIRKLGPDTVSAVARACTELAARRQGALIVFERQNPLDAWAAEGVPLDAAVSRPLLESVFHPGSALHDGAVIVRGDRIAAASCVLPLGEPRAHDLPRSLGTRHRAALGISEETDAVTVAVSEETGEISIAHRGELRTNVAPTELGDALRETLGTGARSPRGAERVTRLARWGPGALVGVVRRDLAWVALALVIAVAILFVAHQDIREARDYRLRLVPAAIGAVPEPSDGELVLVLPGEGFRLAAGSAQRVDVEANGPRRDLDELGPMLAGTLELREPVEGLRLLDVHEVRWREDALGVRFRWSGDGDPAVELERVLERRLPVAPELVRVVTDDLDPRYEVHSAEIALGRSEVTVSGPRQALEDLAAGRLALAFEPVVLTPADTADRSERLALSADLRARGLALADGPLAVTVTVVPATRQLGVVTKEISLACLTPARAAELERWALPPDAETARFAIRTTGLIPAGAAPDSPAVLERTAALRRFVEENLAVFVDVAELPPAGGGRSVPVRWVWRKDWRDSLESLGLDVGNLGAREELGVRLMSEPEILLVEREGSPAEPAGARNSTERQP